MQARYYDPVIGRFYSNDPVGFKNIHNFNRYAYANNNPYKYTDPDGRDATGIGQRLDLRVQRLASGEVSKQQYSSEIKAEGAGGLAGAAIVAATNPVVAASLELGALASGEVPLSASSPVNAVKLEKQLASQSQLTELAEGGGTVLSQPAKQANRIAAQTGADAANIQKVSSGAHIAQDGQQVQTHTFRDASTNTLIEPKTIVNEN